MRNWCNGNIAAAAAGSSPAFRYNNKIKKRWVTGYIKLNKNHYNVIILDKSDLDSQKYIPELLENGFIEVSEEQAGLAADLYGFVTIKQLTVDDVKKIVLDGTPIPKKIKEEMILFSEKTGEIPKYLQA